MSISERIKSLAEKEGSMSKFARKTNIKRSSLSTIITKGGNVRSDTILSIAEAYPNLNIHWLMTGNGKMWLNEEDLTEKEKLEQELKHKEEKLNILETHVMQLLKDKEISQEQNKKLWELLEEFRRKEK